jgi:hypothetical protein
MTAAETKIQEMIATAVAAALAGQASDTATDKTTATKAKASAVKRNLDPIDVDTGHEHNGDAVTMRVIAANASGPCANGARVMPMIGGKSYRTFDRVTVAALADVADDVTKAIDTVDKRAKIGSHKVTVKS